MSNGTKCRFASVARVRPFNVEVNDTRSYVGPATAGVSSLVTIT
jgi:hypothetical protein